MKFRNLFSILGVVLGFWFVSSNSAHAQVTAFTYQGSLASNGAPVTGLFAMQFKLRLANTTQVGNTLTNMPVGVTNGLFTTQLDFGNQFVANNPLYLEIGVIPYGSSSAFAILSPTQLLTPVPYAEDAYVANVFTGAIADSQLSTNIPELNKAQTFGGTANFTQATGAFNGTLSGTFTGSVNATGTFSGASTGTFNGTLVGNGAGVTNVNATNLLGIVLSNPNWQLIQTAAQTAVSGNNYLTTNTTLSTLTLPASPGVGSTVYVSGSGPSGWAVAQNAGQSIITLPLGLQGGLSWSSITDSGLGFASVATSGSGMQMIAGGTGSGGIFYSGNGGQTFTASDAPNRVWIGLASSVNGMRMVAVATSGNIYTSTNGGTNWIAQGGSTAGVYHRVASSADGLKLAAASNIGSGPIYTSTDGGVTWTSGLANSSWSGIASSADGNTLYACSSNTTSRVYMSTNGGTNWNTVGPTNVFSGISCSSDGVHVAVVSPSTSIGGIYVSDDSGNTWTAHEFADTWAGVSVSSNGMYLAAANYHSGSGTNYTSGDYGMTWQPSTNGIGAGQSWTGIAISGTGARILASTSNGKIYSSQATTTPGTVGMLFGAQYSSVQLQYVGNGQWMPLNFTGSFSQQ